MFPISDENPTLRTPIVTYVLIAATVFVWLFVQGAGFDDLKLIASVCNLGLVPGELTGQAKLGTAVPMGRGVACVVDADPINLWTPLTSMFLHGGWAHILGNLAFMWVFGNNVEDSMGRLRFVVFYLVCGIAAAAAQVAVGPDSPIPMVGASGAISGVLGAYLVLYPRVRVNVLIIIVIFVQVIALPAYFMLLWWIGWQILSGLPQLGGASKASGGTAFWAHIGGFVAGVVLIKLFAKKELVELHRRGRHPSRRAGWHFP